MEAVVEKERKARYDAIRLDNRKLNKVECRNDPRGQLFRTDQHFGEFLPLSSAIDIIAEAVRMRPQLAFGEPMSIDFFSICRMITLALLLGSSPVQAAALSKSNGDFPTESEQTDPLAITGTWQVTSPRDNRWRMVVVWDQISGEYRGYLTRNGIASAEVGFEIGELVWKAQPRATSTALDTEQKFRYGQNGQSTGREWVRGMTYLGSNRGARTMTMIVRGVQIRFVES